MTVVFGGSRKGVRVVFGWPVRDGASVRVKAGRWLNCLYRAETLSHYACRTCGCGLSRRPCAASCWPTCKRRCECSREGDSVVELLMGLRETLSHYECPPVVVVPGHFTEVAGTQLEKVPAVVGVFSHLNGPLPPPGFAGTQVSPHFLSSHGQTRVKQVLGRLCVCVCVCAFVCIRQPSPSALVIIVQTTQVPSLDTTQMM